MKLAAHTASAVELEDAPEKIRILPVGHVNSQRGDFEVDQESLESIQKQFKDRGIDIVIDYEHQTLKDVEAPAGGWIKELYEEDGAIVARVEWTPKAASYIKNKEYRYLSPVVMVRESDKKVVGLQSAALTNTPAINGMYPIVNSVDIHNYNIEGGNKMELAKLIQLLGLPEGATEEDAEKAITEMLTGANKADTGAEAKSEVVANKTILGLLGLDETARTEDVSARIVALKANEGTDVRTELLELKARWEKREAEDKVAAALEAGKIMSKQKDWAMEYALKDPAGFDRFVEMAMSVVPMGRVDAVDAPDGTLSIGLGGAVMGTLGLTADDVKKYGGK